MKTLERVDPAPASSKAGLQPAHGSPSVHLDALRGLAAFSVLLSHWREAFFADIHAPWYSHSFLRVAFTFAGLGHEWVIVFFVMSGYLVGGSVLRAVGSGRWSWRGYLLARMTRLYVVLIPALLLGGILDWTGMHLPGSDAHYTGHEHTASLYWDVHTSLTLPVLGANCLFLQTMKLPGMQGHAVPAFGSNGPLWSLCNEFWYYMAFPLLVLMLARNRTTKTSDKVPSATQRTWKTRVACGLGLALWGWFVGSDIAVLGIPWLLGVLVGYVPGLPVRGKWARRTIVAAALVVFAAAMIADSRWYSIASHLLLGGAVAILIWATLHCATDPVPSSYVRVARRAARSSYTLYLTHFPILIFLTAALHIDPSFPSLHVWLVSLGLLAAILIYGQLVYEPFEKQTDRFRDWIKPYVMGRKAA